LPSVTVVESVTLIGFIRAVGPPVPDTVAPMSTVLPTVPPNPLIPSTVMVAVRDGPSW
jgi:hypothetical protein